jgi:hypothetical protein
VLGGVPSCVSGPWCACACATFELEQTAAWLLSEKGGKERRLPAHHLVREYVRAYLDVAELTPRSHARAHLFRSAPRHSKVLSGKPLDRSAVLGIGKRRR